MLLRWILMIESNVVLHFGLQAPVYFNVYFEITRGERNNMKRDGILLFLDRSKHLLRFTYVHSDGSAIWSRIRYVFHLYRLPICFAFGKPREAQEDLVSLFYQIFWSALQNYGFEAQIDLADKLVEGVTSGVAADVGS
jgi:hypothetical protein